MFVGNNRKSEYTDKQKALLAKASKQVRLNALKRERYKEAIWADADDGKIDLLKGDKSDARDKADAKTIYSKILGMMGEASTGNDSKKDSDLKKGKTYSNILDMMGEASVDDIGDDIGDEGESMSDIDESNTGTDEIIDDNEYSEAGQEYAYNTIKALYEEYPFLSKEKINPYGYTKFSNKKRSTLNGNEILIEHPEKGLVVVKDTKRQTVVKKDLDEYDWVKTLKVVKGILEIRLNKKSSTFQKLEEMWSKGKEKREKEKREMWMNDINVNTLSKISNGISVEDQAYKRLGAIFVKYSKKYNLKRQLNPVTHDGTVLKKYYLDYTDGGIIVRSMDSNRENTSISGRINYEKTLKHVEDILKRNGESPDIEEDEQMDTAIQTGVKRYNDSPAKQKKKSIPERGIHTHSWSVEEKRKFVGKIYGMNPWLSREAHGFYPSMSSNGKVIISPTYYLVNDQDVSSDGSVIDTLSLRNSKGVIPKATVTNNIARIDWSKTYERLISYLQTALTNIKDPKIKSDINNTFEEMQAFGTRYEEQDEKDIGTFIDRFKGKGLTGRGLRGAGYQVRKAGRAYNLNDIRGSGTASDLKYRKIGSKFIRVQDLDQGKLKLVYPNRTSVGRIRPISDGVVKLLKSIVYDDSIDSNIYETLDFDDRQLVTEILKACHLKYIAKEPLKEPREHLQAEYDKLKAQIMIGNDNKHLINELKALSVDMYEQGMINKSDFKQISTL